MWNTTYPHFPYIRLGLNPYPEIVFRSTSQIAGARTVNRLFSPFSDVRKKKGLRKSAGPSTLMSKIGFLLSFCGGSFWFSGCFYCLQKDQLEAVSRSVSPPLVGAKSAPCPAPWRAPVIPLPCSSSPRATRLRWARPRDQLEAVSRSVSPPQIMFLRSSSPTISIWCFFRAARLELKKVRPFLFSAIHLPAKVPS